MKPNVILTMTSALRHASDDFVQCVPTKKGHQILYKGYTYVFKTRLQCGSEQWCCSFRQKTEEQLPDWVSIYFLKNTDIEYRCNICEVIINTSNKPLELLEHLKNAHKEVYDLHKENPEAAVGFRIEFLQLHVDDEVQKTQPVIVEEVCETTTEEVPHEVVEEESVLQEDKSIKNKRGGKRKVIGGDDNRKRSWVWKYFHKMSNIIFRCTLCNVVLSIKGCNTNNMNRHIRTRHAVIFNMETMEKRKLDKSGTTEHLIDHLDGTEMETLVIKTEEISASDKDHDESLDSSAPGHRRSWIWLYFNRKSTTTAQCRLCNRTIVHGGNATGNMNRHLKIIHNKTADDWTWIWKVFETEVDYYSCKICQFRCMKHADADKSISNILHHLKTEHGVISGEQIITGNEEGEEN